VRDISQQTGAPIRLRITATYVSLEDWEPPARPGLGNYSLFLGQINLFRSDRKPQNFTRKNCTSEIVKQLPNICTDWTQDIDVNKFGKDVFYNAVCKLSTTLFQSSLSVLKIGILTCKLVKASHNDLQKSLWKDLLDIWKSPFIFRENWEASVWIDKAENLIYLPIYLSMYLSIYLSIYLFIYLFIYYLSIYLFIYGSKDLCWTLAAFSVSWSFIQSVGLLERVISPSQGRYLHTGQHKYRINVDRHSCLRARPLRATKIWNGPQIFTEVFYIEF
jgi:hypothetical protein